MSTETRVVKEMEIIIGNNVLLTFKLINKSGAYVRLMNFGATITNIVVRDRLGKLGDVALGYSDPRDQLTDQFYLGSTIGRFANRLGKGKFRLDNKFYKLEHNDGRNSNHSGSMGYHQRFFDHEIIRNGVKLTLSDKDGNGGFPGTVKLDISYTWDNNNALNITYVAQTDKPTIANFTNHTYFDLSGKVTGILQDRLSVNAGLYLENHKDHLPTGTIAVDRQTFIDGRYLGDIIDAKMPMETGLNRYFIFLKDTSDSTPKAELYNPKSGRQMKVFTSYPGMMIYTGQYLDVPKGRDGKSYNPLSGICLECQHYPDNINHEHFPQAILRPGQTYNEFITYQFDIKP
jgi:aldose 1-epimerase